MHYIFDIAATALLLFIAIQDFRYRAVHWVAFPLLFAAFCASGFSSQSVSFVRLCAINLSFTGIQVLCLRLYFFLRYRKRSFIDIYIGTGDLLMFAALCAAFSTVNFIIFYVLSLLLILLFYIFVRLCFKKINRQIPLAGGMAVIMAIALALKHINGMDFYSDESAMEFIKTAYFLYPATQG